MSTPVLRVLSLGAGVQSTTLALMAARGEIGPMPDAAIFADTGWEPASVYRHLDWLEAQLPFPLHRVGIGSNIRDDALAKVSTTGQRFAAIPWFTLSPLGRSGIGRRQCTKEYKLVPIRRKVSELLAGPKRPGSVEMWVGISLDEAWRRKPSGVKYISNRWPLLELGMRRGDCLRWLAERQYPRPPKSACIGCPYHSNEMWREMKRDAPDEWADAVAVDRAIRNQPGMRGQQFMHPARVPLDEVDLSTAEDRGQLNLFLNECEGMCGV